MRYRVLLLLILISIKVYAEVKIGSISTLLYEHYDEPNLIYSDTGEKNDFNPIAKYLISLTPQFIWRDGRNMLLLNIELFGSVGSLEGSFGKDGKLEGQLKADSFYKGYYKESPLYLKFGKYPGDLPYSFASQITSGQGELGAELRNIEIFYSVLFFNWFNRRENDGSYTYVNEKYIDENRVIQILGSNLSIGKNSFKLRLPVNSHIENISESIYPSVNHIFDSDFLNINSFLGIALRSDEYTLALREEISFKYYNFKTSLLGAHLTANSDISKSYNFTSIDNKALELHYGSHFNYLYQQAANMYGLNTLGIYNSFNSENISLWLSASTHFAVKDLKDELRENTLIGTIFSGGVKINNLWSENTLLEVYCSLFKPEGFSVINGEQTRDLGFQLVVKLQHIIF